eukprot:SAG11_NODE_2892_length_2863_cov_2.334298_2_plen_172_part_00
MAESFFALKRIRFFKPDPARDPPSDMMRTPQQLKCIATMVLVPYFRSKLDTWVKRRGGELGTEAAAGFGLANESFSDDEEDDDEQQQQQQQGGIRAGGQHHARVPLGTRLRKIFVRAWPYINGSYEFVLLLYQFLYLVDRTGVSRHTHALTPSPLSSCRCSCIEAHIGSKY